LSTSAVHVSPETSWKQEVNRRLAEHRERRPGTPAEAHTPASHQSAASRRAQEAAARVAARYATAPSYSEVLASEARAALRAAEAATEAALQAKAAAESVLANLEAASTAIPAPEPILLVALPLEPVIFESLEESHQSSPSPVTVAEPARKQKMDHRASEAQPLTIRWASELPVRSATAVAELHEGHGHNLFEEEWWRPASAEPVSPGYGEIDVVDPALPIHGNLIEFPRELVATRKIRPRLAEASNASAAHVQLSIFEVDPLSIATAPSVDVVQATAAEWTQPAWSGIEFDAQPAFERYEVERIEEPAPRTQPSHRLQTASFSRRLMALSVDGVIVAGALVGVAACVLNKATNLPSVHGMEQIAAAALAMISAMYITLFYAVAPVTPGMKYAGIRFCTFDGHAPTRAQRWNRLGAMLLSVLPAGLGLAWSLFDDDNLSWHDRLSKTYICNG
jgi:uncharacterized RDD family membrane protein YckC